MCSIKPFWNILHTKRLTSKEKKKFDPWNPNGVKAYIRKLLKSSKCEANKIYISGCGLKNCYAYCITIEYNKKLGYCLNDSSLWGTEGRRMLFLCFLSHNCVVILWVTSKICTSSHTLLKKIQQYNLFREGLKHFQNKCIIFKVFPWGIIYKKYVSFGICTRIFLNYCWHLPHNTMSSLKGQEKRISLH